MACALAAAWPVRAGGLPILTVHRTNDARGCPDATALAALVAEQMKRPALQPASVVPPGAARGVEVEISRAAGGFTAVIRANGKVRQFSDDDASCRSLAAAMALSLAVILDPVPPSSGPTTPPSSAPETKEETPEAPSPPSSTAPPAPAPAPATPTPPSEPDDAEAEGSPRRTGRGGGLSPRGFLVVAPVLTLGLVQSWSSAILSEIDVRFGRFSVSGGVLVVPPQTTALSGGEASLDLTVAVARACGNVVDRESLRFALCLMPFAGAMRRNYSAGTSSTTTTVPWAAAGGSALFEQHIWGPLSWGVRADLVFPFVKSSYTEGAFAFNPAPAGGLWDAELRVALW